MKRGSKKYSTYRPPPSPVLGKRLQAARKAWKSFTTALQSKLKLPQAMAMLKFPLKHCLMLNSSKRTFSQNHFRHCNSEEKKIVEESYDETRCKGKAAPVEMRAGKGRREKSPYDVEDAWRAVVAMSPQLRPVDERAHDFISKVREDLKIESQRSIAEFQDMLKRSV